MNNHSKNIKTYGRILAALLAWLGFSSVLVSCHKYGSPFATYKVKGIATSEMDGAPIAGIRAVLKYQPDEKSEMDAAYTDSKGVFNLKGHGGMYVELIDVDGENNGWFKDTTVVADFSQVKFKGIVKEGSEVEKDLGTIKMTLK